MRVPQSSHLLTGTPKLCLGIDPNTDKIPAPFWPQATRTAANAVTAVRNFCLMLADVLFDGHHDNLAAANMIDSVKFQVGWFEALGPGGLQLLSELCQHYRQAGMTVIADAKRGDFGETNKSYARAWLAPGSSLFVDGLTVSPFLGTAALMPYFEAAQKAQSRVYVLARTSNPEGDWLQQSVASGSDPTTPLTTPLDAPLQIWEQIITEVCAIDPEGTHTGFVVGAQRHKDGPKLRALGVRNHSLLVPGLGAQGGDIAGAMSLCQATDGDVHYSNSRSLTYPEGMANVATVSAAKDLVLQAVTHFHNACVAHLH